MSEEEKVLEALIELRMSVKALEFQAQNLNKLYANLSQNNDIIDKKLANVNLRLSKLEKLSEKLENSYASIIDTKQLNNPDKQQGTEKSEFTWSGITTIVVASLGFLAGPILELVRYLLK